MADPNATDLTDAGRAVLEDIMAIGGERALAIGKRMRVPPPTTQDLFALCNLLAQEPGEEALQQLLEDRPGFITGLSGGPDNSDLAVIFKPPVGISFKADFCVLQAHQGGAAAHLIEIESAHERLFTNGGRVAKRLAGAITQVEDWSIWIKRNERHFAEELLGLAKRLPHIQDFKSGDRGFRLCDPDNLEALWRAFGGLDSPFYAYSIIVGRWSQLTAAEKARLLNRNRNGERVRIYTYEQLARVANFRLERDDWYNEIDIWRVVNQA
jgi:hypothetical protein